MIQQLIRFRLVSDCSGCVVAYLLGGRSGRREGTRVAGGGGRVDGGGGHMRERNLDRVFDRVEELDDHVGYVAEGQLPPLVGAAGGRLSDGAPHLQRVEQQGLLVVVVVVAGSTDQRTRTDWNQEQKEVCR